MVNALVCIWILFAVFVVARGCVNAGEFIVKIFGNDDMEMKEAKEKWIKSVDKQRTIFTFVVAGLFVGGLILFLYWMENHG
jgi:Kef-type K+ transport system membrane component KefB